MKFMKKHQLVDVKLQLPRDLPWKVLGLMLKDFGYTEVSTSSTVYDVLISKVLEIIRRRDTAGLMEILPEFEPQSILKSGLVHKRNICDFYKLYQIGSLLKKFPFPGQDTRKKAFEKFLSVEESCKLFNAENYRALEVLNEKHPRFFGILEEIRADIRAVLGDFPDFQRIAGHAQHGPGVSLGDQWKGGKCTEFYKWYNLPYTVTLDTLPLAKAVILSDPRWIGALDDWYRRTFSVPIGHPINLDSFWSEVFKVVAGSETTSVPKTAVIDRTIAKEPVLNVFLQLGVDHAIKRNILRAWGYDLRQQERNQELARKGAAEDLVTVDLSAASDTVTLSLCYMLLPPCWMDLLVDLRCRCTYIDGKSIYLEKISSMGNGFTFALESLIFGALVRAAIRRTGAKKVSAVYGDDLVVPVAAFPYLHELLSLCGFKLNKNKTFINGPFRESCGKDFFHGYEVRPLFITDKITTVKDLFLLCNMFYRQEQVLPWWLGIQFKETRRFLEKLIPRNIREQFFGPMSESEDCYLFSEKPLLRNKYRQRVIWQIVAKPKKFHCQPDDFYFRKLMVNLGPRRLETKWDRKRRFNTGNAFDITRRSCTRLVCTRVALP